MSNTDENYVPPSKLEAVSIMFFSMVGMFIMGGNYGDGVLIAEWLDYFDRGSGDTAWLGTVVLGLSELGAPFAMLMVKRFGLRKMYFSASVVNGLAMAFTALADNIYMAIILRAIAGCGLAVTVNSLQSFSVSRFRNKAALVHGIQAVSFCLGTFASPFLINSCLSVYGWRGCCWIIGGMSLNQCATALVLKTWTKNPRREDRVNEKCNDNGDELNYNLLSELKDDTKTVNSNSARHEGPIKKGRSGYEEKTVINGDITNNDSDHILVEGLSDGGKKNLNLGNKRKNIRELAQTDLFKNKLFVCILIHSFFLYTGVSVIYVHIVSGFSELLEISIEQARFTLSACALSNLIARFIFCLMTQHPRVDALTLHLVTNLVLSIQVATIPLFTGYIAALGVSASLGFLLGAYGCLQLLILADLLGMEYIYMSFAYSIFTSGIGYLIGAPVAGWIRDLFGTFAYSFYFCSCMLAICVVVLIPEWIKHLRQMRKRSHIDNGLTKPEHHLSVTSVNIMASMQSL